METKMTIKTTLKFAILAGALTLSVAQAHAETSFSTLAGIEAETMNAAEMEATQGRFFIDPLSGNLADVFGNVYAYDPDTGTHSDEAGNRHWLGYLGEEGTPIEEQEPGLRFLKAETPANGVLGFNMFGTKILEDGSLVDVFGRTVGSLPGS
jgi:hypothetical protein